MSVRKKDRHVSKQESLGQSRYLVHYALNLTRPREILEDGSQIKAGILGCGQPYDAFGRDILQASKTIHACCYSANLINIKDAETLAARNNYHKKAISFCDSIFRMVDLCIFEYGSRNAKKARSFNHLALLTNNVKKSLQDRMNRDNLIWQQNYSK